MTTDEKFEILLKEFEKEKILSRDFIYHMFEAPDNNESINSYDFIIRQFKELEIIGTNNDFQYYLLPKGVEIIELYGGWLKFKKEEELNRIRKEKKEKYDLKLAKWQSDTFWYWFFIAIIGGISGIIALVIELIK